MVDFDPQSLDRWDAVDDGCPHTATITAGGVEQVLRCEGDAGHEPPCSVTVYWASTDLPQPQEAEQ